MKPVLITVLALVPLLGWAAPFEQSLELQGVRFQVACSNVSVHFRAF